MFKLVYPAIFIENDDDTYTVKFPDLLGCITYGINQADALLMAQDAACGWILGELEDGKAIPAPSNAKDITLNENECVSLMVLDIDSYAQMNGSKAVKKNTTIPAWLNTFGEQQHVNYSQLLTEALINLYNVQMAK